MFLGLSVFEILIISFLVVIMVDCALTYICCSKCLTIFEEEKNVIKAISKLRFFDQYFFTKINLITALFYFGMGYLMVLNSIGDTGYIFFFSCIISFVLNLVTTFVCRVCYCYTCNVLLETKLNELDCLWINFKRSLAIYLPFIIMSVFIPSIYMLPASFALRFVVFVFSFIVFLSLWVVLTPKVVLMCNRAKKIESTSLLRHRLVRLFEAHDIKKYELYYWNTSKSKEANAMVSGVFKYNLLISTSLIETVTLPELESIVMHEIGHIKNKHLLKVMIGKLFIVVSLVLLVLTPYLMNFNNFYKVLFYVLTVIVGFLEIIAGIGVEKKYEMEADSYANSYSDPNLFASALKKVVKYEENIQESFIDDLFSTYPRIKDRIKKD